MFIDTHDLRGNEASFNITEIRCGWSQIVSVRASHVLRIFSEVTHDTRKLFDPPSLGRSCRIRTAILHLGPHFAICLLSDRFIFRKILVVNTSC